jgi:hypothetical protein
VDQLGWLAGQLWSNDQLLLQSWVWVRVLSTSIYPGGVCTRDPWLHHYWLCYHQSINWWMIVLVHWKSLTRSGWNLLLIHMYIFCLKKVAKNGWVQVFWTLFKTLTHVGSEMWCNAWFWMVGKEIHRFHVLQQASLGGADWWKNQLGHQYATAEPKSTHSTNTSPKPLLHKHANSLDTPNAWFWMAGKGIHGLNSSIFTIPSVINYLQCK